jgi:hypothetical protein
MNAFVRGVLAILIVTSPVVAVAGGGYSHGHREYREGGYYQWNAYSCKWIWYPVAKQTYGAYDNHSTTLHMTVNNYQGSARRGDTRYATTEAAYAYGQPLDPNATLGFAKELLGVAYRGAHDGFQQAMSFAGQQGANDVEVAKEFAQVQKLQATAQVIESSKPQPSATVFRQQGYQQQQQQGGNVGGNVRAFVQGTVGSALVQSADVKCAACHADGQGANGFTFGSSDTFDGNFAERALDYITRIDDKNCALKAKLTAEEHRAYRQHLESLKR